MTVPAKKSLGQNFLVNEGVLDRIIAAAGITPADTVLEIGPGRGALTRRLAATGARIVAVEKDRRLIAPLREMFIDAANVEIIEGDALALDMHPGKLVANIPYYLTGRIIRRIIDDWRPAVAVLMVQREVADRIMAQPPDMNVLALAIQLSARPSLVMHVSRGSFRPMPKVDSAVIKLDLEMQTPKEREESAHILAFAKGAFAHKRKQLKMGPRPTARPQELSVSDWRKLAADLP